MTTKQHLTHLESTGLIKLAQTQPELEYLFRHALVQDAAYESLLLTDRKKLHRQAGETLERLYPDRLEEFAPVLAQHFTLADDKRRALKYFTLAGDVAYTSNANAEAIAHYGQAIEIAITQSTYPADQLIHLFNRRGRALELNSRYDEAEANYKRLEKLAAKYNNRALELAGLMGRATLYAIPSPAFNPERGEALCQQTLELAQTLEDPASEARILWTIMLLHFFTSRTDKGLVYGERSLKLARTHNLREQLAYTLNDLAGYCYLPDGKYEQGQAALTEARSIWQELGNQAMLADNLSTTAFNLFLFGDLQQSHNFSSQAYQLNQTIANLWGQAYSRSLTGIVTMEWGLPDETISALEGALVVAEQAGFMAGHVIAGGLLALQYAALGNFEPGLAIANKITTFSEEQIGFWRPHALGSLALVYLRQGNLAGAKETMSKLDPDTFNPNRFAMSFVIALLADCELGLAQGKYDDVTSFLDLQIAEFRRRQMNAYLPYLLYYRGQALLGQNKPPLALEALSTARKLAENLGSRQALWPILRSLSQLESNPAKAQSLRQQAQEIIEYIVNHTPAELRTSFLNRPDVQVLMA